MMKVNILRSPKYPNRQADSDDVKVLFGCDPKKDWPKDGMPMQDIQGITAWVNPTADVGFFRIRAKCLCPVCHRTFALGRINQHHKHMHQRGA